MGPQPHRPAWTGELLVSELDQIHIRDLSVHAVFWALRLTPHLSDGECKRGHGPDPRFCEAKGKNKAPMSETLVS